MHATEARYQNIIDTTNARHVSVIFLCASVMRDGMLRMPVGDYVGSPLWVEWFARATANTLHATVAHAACLVQNLSYIAKSMHAREAEGRPYGLGGLRGRPPIRCRLQ